MELTPTRRYGGLTWEESDDEPEEQVERSLDVAQNLQEDKQLQPQDTSQQESRRGNSMSSDDPRKDYLVKVIFDQLVGGGEARRKLARGYDDTYSALCNGGEMDAFLDQSAGDKPLQASLVQSGGQLDIKLYNEVQSRDEEASVCFSKVGSAAVTADNVQRTVHITAAPRSAVDGLYSSLHNVFLPLLRQNGKLDPSVAALLNDLDASLGAVVRGSRGSAVDKYKVTGILKLEDEISFWRELSDSDENGRKHLNSMIKMQKSLSPDEEEGVSYESLTSALEVTIETELDTMLRDDDYPETRMAHLLKLIGDVVIQFIQTSLAAKDIWRSSFSVADRSSVCGCERVCMRMYCCDA